MVRINPRTCHPTLTPHRSNLFHITGTDIVRCLAFRFQAFGRPVKNAKKFEEGIFSDLRNLKSGTDASLEEPKSPFLDFLYKNNCIRTQKKQKVFYWYSVPHDRLFLDALERDLKREKMAQEPTTVAVSEPALSFEYDSSQSLFEQLTKAQQTNSSSFNGGLPQAHHHFPPADQSMNMPSETPVIPDPASAIMPPPSLIPQHHNVVQSVLPTASHPEDAMPYAPHQAQMTAHPVPLQVQRTREHSYEPNRGQYDRNGVPLSSISTRHTSMPAYMEYSPAPSFVSSNFEEYSARGVSYEPLTPPHHVNSATELSYSGHPDSGVYSAVESEGTRTRPYNSPMMHNAPMPVDGGAPYTNMQRAMNQTVPVSGLEGSPTYKQRRRRSSVNVSLNTSMGQMPLHSTPHSAHRPSGLHRAISQSAIPTEDSMMHDSPVGYVTGQTKPEAYASQRHGSMDDSVSNGRILHPIQTADFGNVTGDEYHQSPLQHSAVARTAGGVFRRARSATVTDQSPYSQKAHACPIPMCGRLFKRLEHLKRYFTSVLNHLPQMLISPDTSEHTHASDHTHAINAPKHFHAPTTSLNTNAPTSQTQTAACQFKTSTKATRIST